LKRSVYGSTPLTSALIRGCIWIKSELTVRKIGAEDKFNHQNRSGLKLKVARRKVEAKQTRSVSPPLSGSSHRKRVSQTEKTHHKEIQKNL
jgi:hypothetical protein